MKPMLASEPCEFKAMRFPLLASYKLDGIRCLITEDGPRTRSLKCVPNHYIADKLSGLPVGLDGELVILDDDDNVNFRATTSAVMSRDGEPKFEYRVFDRFNVVAMLPNTFQARTNSLQGLSLPKWVKIVGQMLVNNEQDVKSLFARAIEHGYEGLILRDPKAPYKHGRATTNSQWMMKMKPWCDAEATIIGVVEACENTNKPIKNELGRTKRSTAQDGLVPKGTLGSLVVQSPLWPKSFEIGTGWDNEEALRLWRDKELVGKVVRFSYVDAGGYDVPRHCSYQGIRDERDM
jgi:DNA ligase-1